MTAQSGFSFNDFAAAGHVAASPEHQGAPMEVTLYSDGSSRGNPGPGGYGTILRYTAPSGAVHEKELSRRLFLHHQQPHGAARLHRGPGGLEAPLRR